MQNPYPRKTRAHAWPMHGLARGALAHTPCASRASPLAQGRQGLRSAQKFLRPASRARAFL